MQSFFSKPICKICKNQISQKLWFCPTCGRDRYFGIKQWEFFASLLIGFACLVISISIVQINFVASQLPPLNPPAMTESLSPTEVIMTFIPSRISPTKIILSPILTDTPGASCPGAPPQRVEVGRRGYVCTQYDRLIVRDGPGKNNTEVTRIEPGTYFRVIDGPKCANNWSWWEIKTDTGIKGWVSEGGDSIDPYFICPQSLSSP